MVCAWNWVRDLFQFFSLFVSPADVPFDFNHLSIDVELLLNIFAQPSWKSFTRAQAVVDWSRWGLFCQLLLLPPPSRRVRRVNFDSIAIVNFDNSNVRERAPSSRECREEGSHSPMFSSGFNNCARKSPKKKDGSMSKCCCILIFFVDSEG